MTPAISVVMPVFNESHGADEAILAVLNRLRPEDELLVVDGGSTDDTVQAVQLLLTESWAEKALGSQEQDLDHPVSEDAKANASLTIQASARLITSRKGRGCQMNTGARQAKGEVLVFVHADTVLTEKAWTELLVCLTQVKSGARFWGRFDVQIKGRSRWLPMIGFFMNRRSRLSRICTGDQCLFMTKALFNRVGGFPDQPLMEDIELSRTLKTQPDVLFIPLDGPVWTSGRRWDEQGAWSTIWLMWQFRWLYWRGASAYDLARRYRDIRVERDAQESHQSRLAGLIDSPAKTSEQQGDA